MTADEHEHDLLGDLAGATPEPALAKAKKEKVKITRVEPAPTKEADPLETSTAATASAIPTNGYRVTLKGFYLSAAKEIPGRKVKLPYELAVNVKKLEGALSLIKNHLLDKALAKRYPDFISTYTHEIVKAEPLSKDTPESGNLQFMSIPRLLEYIRTNGVPVDPKNYPTAKDEGAALRKTVIDYALNPLGFAEREKQRVADMKIAAELEEMNP
jgi:hypothetical protein